MNFQRAVLICIKSCDILDERDSCQFHPLFVLYHKKLTSIRLFFLSSQVDFFIFICAHTHASIMCPYLHMHRCVLMHVCTFPDTILRVLLVLQPKEFWLYWFSVFICKMFWLNFWTLTFKTGQWNFYKLDVVLRDSFSDNEMLFIIIVS